MENTIQGWEHINHLVRFYLNNIDGLEWNFEVGIKNEDGTFRGMPIGFMKSEGFISNPKDEDYSYKMVFTKNGVMFFRKKRGD